MQMIRQLLLLGLLKVILQKCLSLKHQLCLLLADCGHRSEQILNLFHVLLSFVSLSANIRNIHLELGRPVRVAVLKLGLHFNSLPFDILQLSGQFLDLLIILLLLDFVV